MSTLVTIRRYRDLSEAIVARSFLESAGIEAFLYDENLVRLDWQISNFIGGLRLQVSSEDEQEAIAALDAPIPDEIDYAGSSNFSQPHCPRCGSIEIACEGPSRGTALAALYLLSLPLPSGRTTWRCSTCQSRWEEIVETETSTASKTN